MFATDIWKGFQIPVNCPGGNCRTGGHRQNREAGSVVGTSWVTGTWGKQAEPLSLRRMDIRGLPRGAKRGNGSRCRPGKPAGDSCVIGGEHRGRTSLLSQTVLDRRVRAGAPAPAFAIVSNRDFLHIREI